MSVRKVDIERWQKAQKWELTVWERQEHKHGWRRVVWPVVRPLLAVVDPKRVEGDDWNYWWAEQFDGYSFLPTEIGDYIELGCGPFTNTRLIVANRNVRRVWCNDPLIRSYVHFRHAWVAKAYRSCSILIDDHPIEESPFAPSTFDVVVMINVLDHVYDAELCLKNATGLVRPGGYILIGQDLSSEDDAHSRASDVGHPISLRGQEVEPYLRDFDPILRKDLERSKGRNPRAHDSTLIFAGRRKTT